MSSPLVSDVRGLLASSNGLERQQLLRDLYEAISSIETPKETAIHLSLYPLQIAAVRIGHDLKIFEQLEAGGSRSLQELQAKTGAHPLTLMRILRFMSSCGLISQVAADRFETTKKCRNLASKEAVTIVTHFFENCSPLFQKMPAFLRHKMYSDVTDGKDTVFQPAYDTKLDTYAYFSSHPENLTALVQYMSMEQDVRGRWLLEYPFERETQDWSPADAVFVDIGGNVGYYCSMFKEKFANVPGRVVLEDLASTLTHATPTAGVEKLPHDFFEKQPIKGAKFYHLGWVLHNWSDEKAKIILRRTKSAMSSHSVLLINDMVLPDIHVSPYAAALDLVMLGACGGLERTEEEWKLLLGEVGLQVRKTILYDVKLSHSIIVATLASADVGDDGQ